MFDNKDDIWEDVDELDNVVILNDENGEDFRFEFLDIIEYNGEEYVLLLPLDDDDNDDEIVILQIEQSSDGEESYVAVDNEETLTKVFEMFKDKAEMLESINAELKDEFDFFD